MTLLLKVPPLRDQRLLGKAYGPNPVLVGLRTRSDLKPPAVPRQVGHIGAVRSLQKSRSGSAPPNGLPPADLIVNKLPPTYRERLLKNAYNLKEPLTGKVLESRAGLKAPALSSQSQIAVARSLQKSRSGSAPPNGLPPVGLIVKGAPLRDQLLGSSSALKAHALSSQSQIGVLRELKDQRPFPPDAILYEDFASLEGISATVKNMMEYCTGRETDPITFPGISNLKSFKEIVAFSKLGVPSENSFSFDDIDHAREIFKVANFLEIELLRRQAVEYILKLSSSEDTKEINQLIEKTLAPTEENLNYAAQQGNFELYRLIQEQDPSLVPTITNLNDAARQGDSKLYEFIQKQNPALVPDRITLNNAAKQGNSELYKLIQKQNPSLVLNRRTLDSAGGEEFLPIDIDMVSADDINPRIHAALGRSGGEQLHEERQKTRGCCYVALISRCSGDSIFQQTSVIYHLNHFTASLRHVHSFANPTTIFLKLPDNVQQVLLEQLNFALPPENGHENGHTAV